MPTPNPLGEFEGHDVLSHAIELPSLAGGLREASEVHGSAPIPRGERRFILIEVEGAKTRFDPVKNTEGFQRVDIPRVEGLTFVEGEVFQKAIADHKEALEEQRLADQKAKEEAEGVQRVPGTEPWPTDEDDGLPDGPGDLDPPTDPDDAAWEASAKGEGGEAPDGDEAA